MRRCLWSEATESVGSWVDWDWDCHAHAHAHARARGGATGNAPVTVATVAAARRSWLGSGTKMTSSSCLIGEQQGRATWIYGAL
jgi:hypothetical protein